MPVDDRAERLAHRPGTPYEGPEPFIFVSYRHSSWRRVYPIIERLIKEGYRVWYDEGIEAGSEWQEVIQDHVERCAIFLPMVRAEFCESRNCRSECKIASEDGKPIIPIFLDDVRPTHGMRLVLDVQSIYKWQIPTEELFYERLFGFNASVIGAARGEKSPRAAAATAAPSAPAPETPASLFNPALKYQKGDGLPQDYAEAARLYLLAAEQGHAGAQCILGALLSEGLGVKRDDAAAVRWYRKAAEQGDARAQVNLGFMLRNGRGVKRDDTAAVRWYRKAAEQGRAEAQVNLGLMLCSGLGVKRDDAAAVRWFRKAAEQGDARAQCNLGFMLETGRGVTRDPAEATSWFRKAAEQGDEIAQYNLAVMLENGRGVARDAKEAAHWYREAAKKGHAEAKIALERLQG